MEAEGINNVDNCNTSAIASDSKPEILLAQ